MKYENVDRAVKLRDEIRVLREELKKYEEIMNLLQNPGVEKRNMSFEIHVGNWGVRNEGLILTAVPVVLLRQDITTFLINRTNELISKALVQLEAL